MPEVGQESFLRWRMGIEACVMHRPASERNFVSVGLEAGEKTQWLSLGSWCYGGHGTRGRRAEYDEEEPRPWRRDMCETQAKYVSSPLVPPLFRATSTFRDGQTEAHDLG